MSWRLAHLGCIAWAIVMALPLAGRAAMEITPQPVVLDGPESSQQLLVTGKAADGRPVDWTNAVTYEVADPSLASVDAQGLVQPLREGRTEIIVRHDAEVLRVPAEIRGLESPRPVAFDLQIVPLLTKAGCNAGGCHGKAEGQNGFKLSVFGSNPGFDFDAIVKESRGRRVFLPAAERSLFVRKATAEAPHGGGLRIDPGSVRQRLLTRWISEGAQRIEDGPPPVVSLEVEPAERVLLAGETQQLRVTAVDAAGNRRCVTMEAAYDSNAGTIVGIDRRGLATASDVPGEAALLVRYLGHVAVSRITIPRPGVTFERPAEANFIDGHVWNKLARLGIIPSGHADDATYIRRAFLDTIGTLPTPAEVRAFLADADPQKRARLVDQLLTRDEYADYWAMIWSDLLRVDRDKIGPQSAAATARWLRKQFAENRPFDQFARDVLTARGSTHDESPVSFFKVLDTPEIAARSFSQLFLGVRIECAQCHHHPSERWDQDDYFALAGFFTGITRKDYPGLRQVVASRGGTDLTNPRTGLVVPARALGAPPVDFANYPDRREALADWVQAPDNGFFAKALANRLWAHYFGRGLVEPIDDLRATNPASNEPLLAALADHLRAVRYDLRAFTKTLLASRAYQLDSHANESNKTDEQNFSHAAGKALHAEVLLDAIGEATGVPEKFNGWPEGYRAIQVWDNRMPSYFLKIFGRPVRASVCECERSNEPSISQALHLMNSPEVIDKIRSPEGRARRLADSMLAPDEIVDELCLAALARFPTEPERALLLEGFQEPDADRRIAAEDALWTLINLKEFLYNH